MDMDVKNLDGYKLPNSGLEISKEECQNRDGSRINICSHNSTTSSNTETGGSSDSDSDSDSSSKSDDGSDGNQWSDRDNSFKDYESLFSNKNSASNPKNPNGDDLNELLASIDIGSELVVDPEIRFTLRRFPRFVVACLCT